jgi:Kef-type K+ transport system membrane component KefB
VTTATITTLLLIAAISFVSPFLADVSSVPDAVILLAAGIVVGPAILGIAHLDSITNALANLGLATLIFLAGFDIDIERVKGPPLNEAVVGWLMSLALALGIAFALVKAGLVLDTVIVGLSLTTTSIGVLLPIIHDAGLGAGIFGTRIMAIGTVGEFGPIVAVALALEHRDPLITTLLLLLFIAVALLSAFLAMRTHPPKLVAEMRRHLQSSAQLPVRASVLLLFALVYLATKLGLDVLLGAFAAGIVIRLFIHGDEKEVVKGKLEAIGFGFLIPIFFVVSGIRFNLHDLIDSPTAIIRVPIFMLLFLVVRGVPTIIFNRRDVPRHQLTPLALFASTALPLVVVITAIGVSEGRMRPENASALVGAGMLSVLVFPLVGKRLLKRGDKVTPVATTLDP